MEYSFGIIFAAYNQLPIMKTKIAIILSVLLIIPGCDKVPNKDGPLATLVGLSLYWDHEIFGKEGRRIRFEFYGTKQFENSYDLVFNYSINQRDIYISLVDEIDNGKCPRFPTPFGIDSLCTPRGNLYIPDSLLSKGTYTLTLKTPNFNTTSELTVENDSIILNIPSNNHFSCSIHAVYPIPKNLLFGSVVYSGSENTTVAKKFLTDLLGLGLIKTNVPNYPYRHLSVDNEGNVKDSSWPPDNYSLGFIYNTSTDFKEIFNLAKEHFNQANINIYLYTSNGDEARLNKVDGIVVVYSK
jgi:hypothetical protein